MMQKSYLVLAAGLIGLLAQPAAVQDFGGRFEDPVQAAPTQPVQQPTPPADAGQVPDDGFGGSFGDGGLPAPDASSGTAPPPDAPGGGDFGGGSFDPPAGAGGVPPVAPPVAPIVQPPAPPPPPAAPEPPTAPQQGPALDPQIAAFEMRDQGVPPTQQLRSGAFHAPTPTAVPGAQTVTTEALLNAIQGGMQLVLIDVLGGTYSLPNSYMAPELASPGSFNDRTQQRASQWLGQITAGDTTAPIVIYCSGPECWLSYNAVLRTVAAGYTNVYWYRGGLDAWQMAGLQLAPTSF